MKKILLSIFIMGSFGFYVISQNMGNSQLSFVAPKATTSATKTKKPSSTVATTTPVTTVKTPTPTPVRVPAPIATPAPAPVVPPKKKGQYNDGSYTGPVADAYYGNVQVRAIVSGGRLVDVQFLDYPQDRGTSIRINSQAMPMLTQEAISAQSANVNGVSGASATSGAFVQSLSGALAQARA